MGQLPNGDLDRDWSSQDQGIRAKPASFSRNPSSVKKLPEAPLDGGWRSNTKIMYKYWEENETAG
jgi:hypothetical protein